MHLSNPTVSIHFSTTPPDEGKPVLRGKGSLRCPMCGHVCEAGIKDTIIKVEELRHAPLAFEHLTHQLLTYFNASRSCDGCGISSVLPKLEYEHTKQLFRAIITAEWIDLEIARLPSYVDFATVIAQKQQRIALAAHQMAEATLTRRRQSAIERHKVHSA